MKAYSEMNLIESEMKYLSLPSDWLGQALHKMSKTGTVTVKLQLPVPVVLRAQAFCEDIEELSGTTFNQTNLLDLLYNDFLLYAKKNPEPKIIFKMLTTIDEESGKDRGLVQEGKTVFKTVYQNKNYSEKMLPFKVKRKHALRGEILLADLEEIYPDHNYSIELLLKLLYCDFIDKFRKGHNKDAVKNILASLQDSED